MLEELRRRAGRSGLDIILIAVWEGAPAEAEVRSYCELWGIEATVLLNPTATYARQLGVRGVPTNVFVDGDGVVRHVGASTADELLLQARKLAPELQMSDSGVDPERLVEGLGRRAQL